MSNTNPPSATTTSPRPSLQQQQHIYQNLRPPTAPNPNQSQSQSHSQGIMYPVASSGRGFIPKPLRLNSNSNNSNTSGDQMVTVANHGGHPPRPNQLPPYHPRPHLDASLSNHHHHLLHHQHHMIRPPLNQQQPQHPQISAPVRGIPVPSGHLKVTPSPSSIPVSNGYKHLRDKSDETIAIVRDRKVRMLDGASLYALCRSWLRNGIPEESQPQYGDGVKSLPRPLPMPVADTNVVKDKEDEEDDVEKDKDVKVEHLSAEGLLRRHVQHAKHIRARLRDERAKRIERYKTRLSLLLPPLVEQPRNEASAGN